MPGYDLHPSVIRMLGTSDWLGLQADIHRRVVMMPRSEGGRRILPALIETPITGFLDEDGDDIVEDIDMDKACYAVCSIYSDDPDSSMAVELDYKGVTVH